MKSSERLVERTHVCVQFLASLEFPVDVQLWEDCRTDQYNFVDHTDLRFLHRSGTAVVSKLLGPKAST